MEMNSGYKESEVGTIPCDWVVVPLSDCLSTSPSYGVNAPAVKYDSRFPTYIRITDITEDGKFSDESRASVVHPSAESYFLESGDLVFARTGASVGKSYLYDPKDGALVYAGFLIRIRPNPNKLAPKFLQAYAKSKTYWNWIKVNSMRSGQPGINGREYASLPLAIPSNRAEQEAIAEALSDADALIESLDQLIAKKRQIKQGAMQELLTGKRRLPGFSGAWEVKRLEELADIRSGGTPSTTQPQFWDGGVMWCTPTDITALNGFKYLSNTSRTISIEGLKASSAEIIPTHSIVMTSRATIGECAINTVPMTTNQGFKNFVPLDTVDAEFLYYLLTTQRAGFIGLCSGSTFLEIGKTQLSGYQVQVPKTKSEQTAIATVLSDMDTELAALESRLAKARQIKQGMMQELLTGRIRLL
ncbi:MAG: restriction endonuclease subunit S [Proteobacteria bacterium]|nr:restriction endonuclease subunit S [Pseudomonadota bacterium]